MPVRIRRPRLPAWVVAVVLAYPLGILVLDHCLPRRPSGSLLLPTPGAPQAFSRDGRSLVTLHRDEGVFTLCVWDWRAGRVRSAWQPAECWPEHVLLSPDVALLAGATSYHPKETDRAWYLRLWDVATTEEVAHWLVQDDMGDVAFSRFAPDGRTLAFTCRRGTYWAVWLWDIPGRRRRAVLPEQRGPLAFSPDGRLLATAAGDRPARIRVWDVWTGAEYVDLEHPPVRGRFSWDLVGHVPWLAFSRDGRELGVLGPVAPALADGEKSGGPTHLARVWDVVTGRVRAERPLDDPIGAAPPEAAWEGVRLVVGQPVPDEERVADPLTGAELVSFRVRGPTWRESVQAPAGPRYWIDTAADGEIILVQQSGGLGPGLVERFAGSLRGPGPPGAPPTMTLRVYDGVRGRRLATLVGQYVGCQSPDGRLLATYTEEETTVQVWELPPPRPWPALLGWAAVPSLLAGLLAVPAGWARKGRGARTGPSHVLLHFVPRLVGVLRHPERHRLLLPLILRLQPLAQIPVARVPEQVLPLIRVSLQVK
jgi:hypothetical protein